MRNCMPSDRLIAGIATVCVLFCVLTGSGTSSEPQGGFTDAIAPLLRKHCLKCHSTDTEVEGDVNLQSLRGDNWHEQVELVRRLVDVLRLEEMPPEGEPPLPPLDRRQLVRHFQAIMHGASASAPSRFAHTPIRRMNRFQYNNALIDLFDLKCTVFTLPERMMREHNGYFRPDSGRLADVVTVGSRPLGKSQMIERRLAGVAAFPQDLRAEHGYDNRADHLSLSPMLMESFLRLGRSVTDSPDFNEDNVGIWRDFFAAPADGANHEEVIRNRLTPFLFRAFRRPPDAQLLERYVRFTLGRLDAGDSFTGAMKSIAAATVSSPRFLYLYDKSAAAESAEAIDDFELASRLSFFLWGSIPDQALLDHARAGEFKEPDVLEAQFRRMLSDHKLKRFCDSFPA